MKKRKDFLKCIVLILLLAFAGSVFAGCAKKTQEPEGPDQFMVYYTNQNANDIIYRIETVQGAENMEQVELIQTLLDLVFTQNEEDTTYYTVKPENVNLQGIIAKDGLVTLDFNAAYLRMTNVREIIFRASVVLTLLQVPGITGVSFTVDQSPIVNSNGDMIGTMTKDTFVNVLLNEEGMLKQETDLTIYFANETGEKLVPVLYRFTIDNSNYSMEEYILSRLLEGPAEGEALRTISSQVSLNGVVTTDHICYVNFSKEFLEQEQKVSDEIMIYSIVDSLCQLTYVHSVKFMVDGETEIILHGSMDLTQPIVRDLSYIE
ncbi:MAG: GerMN domain-containing protein [Parasporobacterium sp.]|nr:GerMN domain-containing protein [Parasporobacterium sp.]